MSWVILGAGGLVGRHLVEVLGPGKARALDRRACDVTQLETVMAACADASVIVNCASYTDVDGAESEAEKAFAVNAVGAEHVARAARRHGAALVHLSTDFVFDGRADGPYDEHARPNPINTYGRSKLAGEDRVRAVGADTYLVRLQAIYGRGGRNFPSRLPDLLARGTPLRVDAERLVQPTWALAVARQIVAVARSGRLGTYHVSCKGTATWADFARAVARELGLDANVQEVDSAALGTAARRPRNCLFDHGALARADIDRMPDWRDALREYLATWTASARR